MLFFSKCFVPAWVISGKIGQVEHENFMKLEHKEVFRVRVMPFSSVTLTSIKHCKLFPSKQTAVGELFVLSSFEGVQKASLASNFLFLPLVWTFFSILSKILLHLNLSALYV